jgi:hypothetical protein
MTDDEILTEARGLFELAAERENVNRIDALDDIRFARLSEQWDPQVIQQRMSEGRPCLTINKMPAFIRQVVNDARQNAPSIKVLPADSGADPETAEIINGLIRNIEVTSDADVAYDTALESAVVGGFGFFRIDYDYSTDDTFEKDLKICRIANPFAVFADPFSTACDSSDWNVAFVVDKITKAEFERRFKDKDPVDWDGMGYVGLGNPWFDDIADEVMIAEYWTREEVEKTIYGLTSGEVVDSKTWEMHQAEFEASGVFIQGEPRVARSYKVTQRVISGAEVLETNDWPGKYIPIVPVYGDEVNVEGRRYFRSLIRDAKDAQRMFNYWRTASTELVALAPKAPFIGRVGAFDSDAEKWATANTATHAYMEYDGPEAPQRQPFAGPPAGALQEALNASDDMKAIIGLYDASLGARSNETSGRAILARQREGDVSTFHFIDNLSRAIRHAGRVLIDLIPAVYNTARVVRVMGPEEKPETVQINQPFEKQGEEGPELDEQGNPVLGMYDLSVGKYDLTVKAGPSYTTQRQEAAEQMMQLIQSFPAAAPVIGDLIAANLDWPGADDIAERLKALLPPQAGAQEGGVPPELQQMIMQGQQQIETLTAENAALKANQEMKQAELKIKIADLQIKAKAAETNQFQAETERMQAVSAMQNPPQGWSGQA